MAEDKNPRVPNSQSLVNLSSASDLPPLPQSPPAHSFSNSALSLSEKRRLSSRSIKRKKFDDELVESSLAKNNRIRTWSHNSTGSQSDKADLYGLSADVTSPSHLLNEDEFMIANPEETSELLPEDKVSDNTSGLDNFKMQIDSTNETVSATFEPVSGSVASAEKEMVNLIESQSNQPSTSLAPSSPVHPPMASVKCLPPTNNGMASQTLPQTILSNGIPSQIPPTTPTPTNRTQENILEKKTPRTSTSKNKTTSKRTTKKKPFVSSVAAIKDLGRWKAHDDLLLIVGVQQTCELQMVYTGVKFSCKFTLKEIQERWYALLYDPVISQMAVTAMKQLHPDTVAQLYSKALFSKAEESLLGKVVSTSSPSVEVFQDLLNKHPDVFHQGRTPKSIQNHWFAMKMYHLLPDQTVQPLPKGDHVLNFSDAEDAIEDAELQDPPDEALEHELSISDRRQKKEIRRLEAELPRWQVLVDTVTGVSPPDFDNQTLAVLRGRLVRYLMRSREITIGRATKDNQIDVDLSLEGPAWKVSRRQGIIKLKNNGDFFISNEGQRAIYVDGKPVTIGNKFKLSNNAVVEIAGLRFIFLINTDLIHIVRAEAAKSL